MGPRVWPLGCWIVCICWPFVCIDYMIAIYIYKATSLFLYPLFDLRTVPLISFPSDCDIPFSCFASIPQTNTTPFTMIRISNNSRNIVQYCIMNLVSSPGLFMMIQGCQRSLMDNATANTCPFHCNKETKVNAFDRGDISEWNEEEMQRWQLGQIACEIEHDKPLIVISMWTLREWSVYDDREYEWIWNSFEWKEVGRKVTRKVHIFYYMRYTRRYAHARLKDNSGLWKTWVWFS